MICYYARSGARAAVRTQWCASGGRTHTNSAAVAHTPTVVHSSRLARRGAAIEQAATEHLAAHAIPTATGSRLDVASGQCTTRVGGGAAGRRGTVDGSHWGWRSGASLTEFAIVRGKLVHLRWKSKPRCSLAKAWWTVARAGRWLVRLRLREG
eukprot:3305135-Prymnesium_polylepis.1